MTPPLRIQLLAGAQSGLQTTHTQPRLVFGRDAATDIAIDEAHLSRQHGELVCAEGYWSVVNHSANGTTVNGKKLKGDQPRVLKPGDVVGVGKIKLFAVQYAPGSTEEVAGFDTPAPEAVTDAGNQMSRRGKLWMALGIYGFIMLVVFIVIISFGGDGGGGGRETPPQLRDQIIENEIEAPYEMPRDEAKAIQHLERARETYERTGASPRAMYDALHNYKLHLAYAKTDTFNDGGDVLAFNQIKTTLTKQLIEGYRQAYTMVRGRQWLSAEKKLRELQAMYPASDSDFYDNLDAHLSFVRTSRPRR